MSGAELGGGRWLHGRAFPSLGHHPQNTTRDPADSTGLSEARRLGPALTVVRWRKGNCVVLPDFAESKALPIFGCHLGAWAVRSPWRTLGFVILPFGLMAQRSQGTAHEDTRRGNRCDEYHEKGSLRTAI